MASVTQCDACGKIIRHEQGRYIKIYRVTAANKLIGQPITAELCNTCTGKLGALLNIDLDTNTDKE